MGQSERNESLDIPFEVSEQETAASAQVIAESTPFIGQWNRLISTTNWEKGKIIFQWREEMRAGGFTPAAFSDETWSQIVGGVTPQHVGRLRRTWERFGDVYSTYQGIFWSHFYAALDWNDAELWLEGAVQNRWSVSQMRTKRWESLGQPAGQEPRDMEIVSAETDEEAAAMAPRELASRELDTAAASRQQDPNFQSEPRDEGPDFGDSIEEGSTSDGEWVSLESPESLPPARLFESFRNLPEDFAEATSAFKLAIVRHKAEGWEAISQAEVLRLLDALKMFAQIRATEEKRSSAGREAEGAAEAE